MHIWNTDIHVVINSLENSLRTSKILHTDHSVLFTHATNRETDTFSLNESTMELSSEKCILYIAKCKLYLRRTIFYKTSLSYLEHRLLTTSCNEMLSFILCFSDFFLAENNMKSPANPTHIPALLHCIQKWFLNENEVFTIFRDYILY